MLNIAVIIGSLRQESFNRKLALALDKLEHPKFHFSHLKIDDIPFFNQDLEEDLPHPVLRLKNEIATADAILFVTPEYNRSIPGVLKNIIDWGSRPAGQNVWSQKPMTCIGTSPGAIGTAVAQSHLRSIMVSIDAIFFGQPEVYLVYKDSLIDEDLNITEPSTKNFLEGFLDTFASKVEQHKSLSK